MEFSNTSIGTTNLKGYYKFESGSLGTDSSGNSHNLNVTGADSVGGMFFGGINFTTSEYGVIGDALDINGGACSYAFWIRLTAAPTANQACIFQGNDSAHVYFYIGYWDDSGGNIRFQRTRTGVSDATIDIVKDLGINIWHHIAMTYDGSTLKGYIDGVYQNQASASGNGSSETPGGFWLNSNAGGSQEAAIYSNALVFNDALTAGEIAELANRGEGSFLLNML